MEDTAQAVPAETPLHEQFANAAANMQAARSAIQNRNERGQFAPERVEEPAPVEDQPLEAPFEAEADFDDQAEYEDEGPDADQPEPVAMPKSWSKEDAETWNSLPPEAQARIAEREGQRDTALNSKFQELANVRKDFESRLSEANASRDKWAQDYDLLVADLSLPKPDPRAYGLGTPNYNRDAYDLAVLEWEQGSQHLQQLKTQRETIRAQQQKEQLEAWSLQKAEIDAAHEPKLIELMPELTDPQKAEPAMRSLVTYAIEQGIPADNFSEENQPYITRAQLALLAKAKKFDELSSSGKKPAPKTQPAVKPGVSTPRAARNSMQTRKAMDRLASEGSIEAAVAAMAARRR